MTLLPTLSSKAYPVDIQAQAVVLLALQAFHAVWCKAVVLRTRGCLASDSTPVLRLWSLVWQFFIEPVTPEGGTITIGGKIQLLGFCVFEGCVGIFWPSIMKMRSQYIPEESRSTIMNFFRIPLNLFVCIVLYNVRTPFITPLTALMHLHSMKSFVHHHGHLPQPICLHHAVQCSNSSFFISSMQKHWRMQLFLYSTRRYYAVVRHVVLAPLD